MKKSITKKILFMVVLIGLILLISTIKSNAASLSISTSKSSVSPGGTFTVTVSVSGGAGKVTTSVSNGSGGKTDFLDNSSYSFTCTAGSSGSVTIKASGSIADYTTEEETSKSASKTVTIVANPTSGGSSTKPTKTEKPKPVEVEKSKDNTLKELTIEEGQISPEFNKDVKEYTLRIPYEVTAVNITATPTDSKATVVVTGNTDLKEGENAVTVKVTAEDGTVADYLIKVTRARVPLALSSLVIKYENENGELIELPLNPIFDLNITEYMLEDIEYWVEKLFIEAIPNIEGATVEVQGADTLQVGENTIVITLKIASEDTGDLAEGEEPKEEIIEYTIKVNKKEEPTLIAKISNWFKGIFGGVTTWFGEHEKNIIVGSLATCVIALCGLSIYIVIDYNKYKDVINKLKKVDEINSVSNISIETNQETQGNIDQDLNNKKNGKRFK